MHHDLDTDMRAGSTRGGGAGAGVRWASAARTHPGLRRGANEDRWLATGGLLAVADGVGGERAGELAATVAISELLSLADAPVGLPRLMRAFEVANRTVLAMAERHPERAGMATTLTAAALHDGMVAVVHAGDSRAYRLRSGRLEALTQDHSFGGELARSGLLSPEEAARHPMRSVLTRCLGHAPRLQVDAWQQPLLPGDVYVLCSDGLTDVVKPDELCLLASDEDLDAAAERLVEAALEAGAPDNVTVVLARAAADRPAAQAARRRAAG